MATIRAASVVEIIFSSLLLFQLCILSVCFSLSAAQWLLSSVSTLFAYICKRFMCGRGKYLTDENIVYIYPGLKCFFHLLFFFFVTVFVNDYAPKIFQMNSQQENLQKKKKQNQETSDCRTSRT